MTVREALEVVREGEPWERSHSSDAARQLECGRYERAWAILEAARDEIEAQDQQDNSMRGWLGFPFEWPSTTYNRRRLERGEGV